MQIGALWTILYASLIDLLSFLKPFLKREGDFSAMAERLSAPFAAPFAFCDNSLAAQGAQGTRAHPTFQEAKILPYGMDVIQLPAGIPEQFRQLSPMPFQRPGKGGACAMPLRPKMGTRPARKNTATGIVWVLLRNICLLGADIF